MDPDMSLESLQRKVQFDIRLYFFRRGSENMETMKKDYFKVQFNKNTDEWMVTKTWDELTKNHRDIENKVAGVMPEDNSNLHILDLKYDISNVSLVFSYKIKFKVGKTSFI